LFQNGKAETVILSLPHHRIR